MHATAGQAQWRVSVAFLAVTSFPPARTPGSAISPATFLPILPGCADATEGAVVPTSHPDPGAEAPPHTRTERNSSCPTSPRSLVKAAPTLWPVSVRAPEPGRARSVLRLWSASRRSAAGSDATDFPRSDKYRVKAGRPSGRPVSLGLDAGQGGAGAVLYCIFQRIIRRRIA